MFEGWVAEPTSTLPKSTAVGGLEANRDRARTAGGHRGARLIVELGCVRPLDRDRLQRQRVGPRVPESRRLGRAGGADRDAAEPDAVRAQRWLNAGARK